MLKFPHFNISIIRSWCKDWCSIVVQWTLFYAIDEFEMSSNYGPISIDNVERCYLIDNNVPIKCACSQICSIAFSLRIWAWFKLGIKFEPLNNGESIILGAWNVWARQRYFSEVLTIRWLFFIWSYQIIVVLLTKVLWTQPWHNFFIS